MKKIYYINSVIPKAFTDAKKALENLWALEAPLHQANSLFIKAAFIKDGAKILRSGCGRVQPQWREGCPCVTTVELY